MRFLITIARLYPGRSALTLVSLLFASVAEGLSLLLLLPSLNLLTGDAAQGPSNGLSGPGRMLTEALSAIGVTPTVGALLFVMVICLVLKAVFLLLANAQIGYTVAHVATDLQLSLLRSLMAAQWEFYLRQPVGSLTNAIGTEALRASQAYLQGVRTLVLLIQSIVFAGAAFFVTWKGALLSLSMGGIILYGLRRLVRMTHHAGMRQTQLLKSLLARLADCLQSVKPLKAMAREELVGSLLRSENRRLNRALRQDVISTETLSAAQDLMMGLIITSGLYVALIQLKLPFNAVLVMILVLARALASLGKTQRQYQKIQSYESAFWSLQAVIEDARRARETNPKGTSPRLEKSVRLNNVSFGYGKLPVLGNASLTVPAGSFTAIMGPSGAGKTSIADLIIGLLRPQQGEILIDNVPLEQVDLRQWRRMIGYVPQESFLLHETVLWNVTLGDPEVSEADAEAALRAAGAWEFVAELPQQIHSSVAERGMALSGGQRQRIAIARALARRPKLLILDEVTSSLDPQTEAALCQTLQGLRGQLTILAISHQPAVVDAADTIYRIQNGEVILVRDGRELNLVPGEIQGELHSAQANGMADAVRSPSEDRPPVRVWVLLDYRAGDNAQILRLAQALGWPFEEKHIRYNRLNRCPNLLLAASKLTVDTRRSDPLAPPWPDLVIGASRRAAPLARWIKKQSGGRCRLVHLLHTQAPLHYFDLVVTTPQYRLPERSNVLHNLLPLNAAPSEVLESAGTQWRERLEHLPRPWIAVLVGGNTSSYRLDAFTARQLGQFTSRTARETGGSLLISSSPRTPPDAADALSATVQAPAYVYRWQPNKHGNPYLAYLALADRFIVTADSASMLAEACSTGRPVELFGSTRPRRKQKRLLRAFPRARRLEEALIAWGIIKPKRDLQALHRELIERGLLCSPGQEQSLQPAKPDDLARTVTRIRRLMDGVESERAPTEPKYQERDYSPKAHHRLNSLS